MKYPKKLNKVFVYCDGASRGNPGSAAIAYIIKDKDGHILKQANKHIGECTNNIAEYKAIIEGLNACSSFTRNEVILCSDSNLAIKQISKIWKINKDHLKKLYFEVKNKESLFNKVTFIHKLRANENIKEVDKLVNKALDS
ncbi:MAG: ribonuclease HI family protein [Promethearchaeota archaeon]